MQSKAPNIKNILREHNIDGAIISSPENFHYICGFAAHQHTVSRQPAFASAVLSSSDSEPVFAITMDFEAPAFIERSTYVQVRTYDTWVGVKKWGELTGEIKTVDKTALITHFDTLHQIVSDLNLCTGVIGIEMDFLPLSYYKKLTELFPNAEFVNISVLFVHARSVKNTEEIEMFRILCQAADNAFFEVSKIASVGVSEKEMSKCFRENVLTSGVCFPSSWSMFTVGNNCSRLGLPGERRAAEGDIIKLDAGVNAEFDFYTTDTSRSWIVGKAHPLLHKIKDRLFEAQRLMIEVCKPGLPINELFFTGFNHVSKTFPSYRRGHLGHSISMGPATAEAPYISPKEDRLLETGMVLAIEAPLYIDGVGGFNIEDMVLVTKDGCEILTPKTPHYILEGMYA